MSAALLSVEGLAVHFSIAAGGLLRRRYVPLKAVDGVSFELHPARRSASSANRAAASRRSAAPCCV